MLLVSNCHVARFKSLCCLFKVLVLLFYGYLSAREWISTQGEVGGKWEEMGGYGNEQIESIPTQLEVGERWEGL